MAKQWNTPNYEGVDGRVLTPAGVKEMNCHITPLNIIGMNLKLSEPIDLDRINDLVNKHEDEKYKNDSVLRKITDLPLMYGQNGRATKFVKLANGGFQIDWVGGLPGGDWETDSYPSSSTHWPYIIPGTDIFSTQVLVFVNGSKLSNLLYEVRHDETGENTMVYILDTFQMPECSLVEIMYRRNVELPQDVKVKVNEQDCTGGYLFNKIVTSNFLDEPRIVKTGDDCGSLALELSTKFDIPVPTSKDVGSILAVNADKEVYWTGDIGSVFTMEDNRDKPNKVSVHNGENVKFCSEDIDVCISEPVAGENVISLKLKDDFSTLKLTNGQTSTAVNKNETLKVFSENGSLNVDIIDTDQPGIDIQLQKLSPSLQLFNVTDNRNTFDSVPNQTVKVNAHTNLQFTSKDKSINIGLWTPVGGNNEYVEMNVEMAELPGAYFTSSNPSGNYDCMPGADKVFDDVSQAVVYGKTDTIQDGGNWTYVCPRDGKILVNAQMSFKSSVASIYDHHKMAICKDGIQVAEVYTNWNVDSADKAIEPTHHQSVNNTSKIINVTRGTKITLQYEVFTNAKIHLTHSRTFMDVTYLN